VLCRPLCPTRGGRAPKHAMHQGLFWDPGPLRLGLRRTPLPRTRVNRAYGGFTPQRIGRGVLVDHGRVLLQLRLGPLRRRRGLHLARTLLFLPPDAPKRRRYASAMGRSASRAPALASPTRHSAPRRRGATPPRLPLRCGSRPSATPSSRAPLARPSPYCAPPRPRPGNPWPRRCRPRQGTGASP